MKQHNNPADNENRGEDEVLVDQLSLTDMLHKHS